MKRKWLRSFDLVIIVFVLLIAALLFFFVRRGEAGDTVRVFVDNDLYTTLSLSDPPKEHTVVTARGSLTLSVTDAGVAVTASDCPDDICVRTGRIARRGESIVCAPLGVSVTVGDAVLDGVTG